MRSLGLPELLIIAGIIALLVGGARLPRLFDLAGRRLRSTLDQIKWIYESVGGTEEDEVRAEERVGAELAREFLAQMPPDPDEALQERVAAIGKRLADTAAEGKREFRFRVVQGPVANAYALPGGNVFVTRSMVDACGGSEGEMAVLLAHEMGHVLCRHMAERKVIETLLGAVRAGQLAHQLLGKGYSREQELEADSKAVELALEAGYDAGAPRRLMGKLASFESDRGAFAQYFSTHPSVVERVAEVEAALDRRGA